MINSRFTVAVHLLALLSVGRKRFSGPLTSEMAAESVNTNPVVIRRILGDLRKAGIVSSQPGPSGGWFLEREPDQITLSDVYRAIETEQLFAMHHRKPNPSCLIGGYIQDALHGIYSEAEAAMQQKLGEKTLADVIQAVQAHAGLCPAPEVKAPVEVHA
jgi:Rrf2 family protein